MERLNSEMSEESIISTERKDFTPIKSNAQSADYITDEIIAMMYIGDIHESNMFPQRQYYDYDQLKTKFPWNQMGINSDEQAVMQYIDKIIEVVMNEYQGEVINRINKMNRKDPIMTLEKLQSETAD